MAQRNKEARFIQAPMTGIQRSTIPYSQKKIFTAKMADLIPFFCEPTIMPGDTFKINLGIVARLLTPINPTMDDLFLDTYFFFVPYRLVWSHFKEFMGENTSGAWVQEIEYTKPKLIIDYDEIEGVPVEGNLSRSKMKIGSVWDYMYGGNPNAIHAEVDALPARAYVLIYNEWFRDENWIAPKSFNMDETTVYYDEDYPEKGGYPYKIAKYHDIFTSLLPAPQKGTAVIVPVGDKAPIKGEMGFIGNVSGGDIKYNITLGDTLNSSVVNTYYNGNPIQNITGIKVSSANPNSNAYADLGEATIATINTMREAFAYQRILEKMARGGSRYVEIVKSFWGVTAGDARLQRPEYLGGKSLPINFQQVPQTSSTDNTSPQGNLGAFSHTADADRAFTKSFTEHGVIIGLMAIRQKHSYQQGLEKVFTQFRRYDNYFPQLANLGEQAVKRKEIYNTGITSDNTDNDEIVLGFQEAWYQYRYRQDTVAGYMRSGITGSLDIWHYADYYENAPVISETFINETDAYLRRTLAVTDNETHQFLITTMIKGSATRPMPLYSIPGLIDHH